MAKGVPEDVLNVLPSGVISRFLPAVPGAATRRGIATLTGSEFGPGRGYKIWPSGCGVPQFHAKSDAELEQRLVATQHLKLAVPKRHPLTKLKKPPAASPNGCAVFWFPRRGNPVFYDRMMLGC